MSSPAIDDPPQFPAVPLAGPRQHLALPRSHFGDLVPVAEWFSPRRAAAGALQRPRVVLVVGRREGPDDGSGDPDAVADWCDRLGAPSGASVGLLDHSVGNGEVASEGAASEAGTLDAGEHRRLAEEAGNSDTASSPRHAPAPSRSDSTERPAATAIPHSAARAQVLAAIEAGRRAADAEVDAGMDLLIPGLVGTGQAVPIGTLISLCVGLEPAEAAPVSGADVDFWSAVVAGIRDQRFRLRNTERDAVSVLVGAAAVDVAALVGLIGQAAVRRTPVLLDGTAVTLAALLANRLAHRADTWFLSAGPSTLRGCRRLQEMLGLPAVTALGTDSAVGAVLLLPLIQAVLAAVD